MVTKEATIVEEENHQEDIDHKQLRVHGATRKEISKDPSGINQRPRQVMRPLDQSSKSTKRKV